jgi:hypothetical protein
MPSIRIYSITAVQDGTGRLLADVEAIDDAGQPVPNLRQTVAISATMAQEIFSQPTVEAAIGRILQLAQEINPAFAPSNIVSVIAVNATAQAMIDSVLSQITFPVEIPF